MQHKPLGIYEKFIKRLLDFLISLSAIVLLFPILLVIALLVRVKLGSPVIFSQERPGKNENIFRLYKFRSMTNGVDAEGNLLSDDKRLTDFGKRLRATSLDELPELINILKGDMSLVGPRPLLVKYLPYYSSEERMRHRVRPGLTGLAQINGRNNAGWDDRLKMDIQYVNRISFWGDLKIVISTILKVIGKKDVVEAGDFKMKDLDEERKTYGN